MEAKEDELSSNSSWARIAVKMAMGQQGAFDILSAEELALFWRPASEWTTEMREKMKPYGGEMIAATDLAAETSPSPGK